MPPGSSRRRLELSRWLGPQARSSSSCVESALGLGEAGPAAGSGVLAGRDPARARLATDRRIAIGEKGVDLDLVVTRIREKLVEGPRGERVDLDEAVLGIPGDERGVGAGRPLVAAHSRHPGLVEGEGAGQW